MPGTFADSGMWKETLSLIHCYLVLPFGARYHGMKVHAGADVGIGNQRVLLPKDFDLDMIDPSTGYTNRQLLSAGNNPVDPNGVPYEWHQVGQKKSAPLALLTHEQHRENFLVLHPDGSDAEGYAGQSSGMWETSIKKINKLLAGE